MRCESGGLTKNILEMYKLPWSLVFPTVEKENSRGVKRLLDSTGSKDPKVSGMWSLSSGFYTK